MADIFVLPSRYDGWGVVVNQALGAGLPLICSSEVRAADDLVADGVNGLIVTAGDSNGLAASMGKLAMDREQRNSFARSSREKSDKWTLDSGVKKWLQIFSEMRVLE